jgi:hypothetical protein
MPNLFFFVLYETRASSQPPELGRWKLGTLPSIAFDLVGRLGQEK